MKVLIIENPGFGQDINALCDEAGDRYSMRIITTQEFGEQYLRYFPRETLGLEFGLWEKDEFAEARRRWRKRAFATIRRIHRVFPFDVVLAPADDTPYFRDIIDAIYSLGAPYVMLMKEVLRPPFNFHVWAPAIRKHFPVKASHVLVNSGMNRDYILQTGGNESQTWITGQPRFDIYARRRAETATCEGDRLRVLFLSYEIDVYMPLEARRQMYTEMWKKVAAAAADVAEKGISCDGYPTWSELRVQTLIALGRAVSAGKIALKIKPHPQMLEADRALDQRVLRVVCGDSPFVEVEPQSADTRELICAADVVVGFQTTALLEALAAGKRTIYTYWSEAIGRYLHGLIPYHEFEPVLIVAKNPEELSAAIENVSRPLTTAEVERRDALIEQWIGRIDGQATARVWAHVDAANKEWESKKSKVRPESEFGRRCYLSGEIGRGFLRAAVLRLAGLVLREPRLGKRADQEWHWIRSCGHALGLGSAPHSTRILLPIPIPIRRWTRQFRSGSRP